MDAPYRRSKEMNEVVKNAGVAWADAEVARLDGVIKENDHADDKAARARLLEYRDALKSAPAAAKERVGSEGDEWRDLVSKLELRNYIKAAVSRTDVRGREAEYNKERGLAFGWVPLDAIAPLEYRTDTALTSGDYDSTLRGVIQQVFKSSDLTFAGANIFTTPPGEQGIPVIAGTGLAAAKAKAASTTPGDAALSVKKLNPSRHTIAIQYALEEEYEFSGLETPLREYLAGRLSEQLDNAVMNTATTGILAALTAASTSSTTVVYGDLSKAILGMVDGIAAGSESDVRVLLGAASYQTIAAPTSPRGLREVNELRAMGVGVKSSAHIPAPTSDNQTAILTSRGADVPVAVWDAVRIVKSDVAETGRIRLDAHMFMDWTVARDTYW